MKGGFEIIEIIRLIALIGIIVYSGRLPALVEGIFGLLSVGWILFKEWYLRDFIVEKTICLILLAIGGPLTLSKKGEKMVVGIASLIASAIGMITMFAK